MSDQVQQIKERLNIVDIVGQYVKLSKAGKNYKGLSPFGTEKTPSFFVSPDKGMYYDFSSGQGGDIFSFVQKVEGVDFKGALHILAEKAGIQLQKVSKQARDQLETHYLILEEATKYYETKLSEHEPARTYLANRGLEESTMRSFRIGYSADEWQNLLEFLTTKGFTERDIETVGLIKKGEQGRYYDRFRSRILFPITDSVGRVVAFSGRIFGDAAKDEKNAKYLNSPETPLFDKSRILFGYNKAKQSIRKYDFTILVEGQMDLVMSHQAGYTNTVAVSGTGLTEHHLMLIERLSKNVVMAFDADAAGVSSSGRAASLALQRGMDVKVARVPLGKDPADCILESVDTWKETVRTSKHVVDFYLDIALSEAQNHDWDQRKLILHARDTVLPYVQMIVSSTDKAHFIRNYANVLGIAEEAVWDEIRKMGAQHTQPKSEYVPHQPTPAEKKPFSRKIDHERALAGFLFWQDSLPQKLLTDEVLREKVSQYNIPLEVILARFSEEKDALIFQAEITFEPMKDPLEELYNLMKDLARMYVTEELIQLSLEQKKAERDHDTEKESALSQRSVELSRFKSTLE